MSDRFIEVVNSTTGLGDTEYSFCDGRGLLKFDKPAMEECCEIINKHDSLTAQNKLMKQALRDIIEHMELVLSNPQISAAWNMASKALLDIEISEIVT